MSRKSKCFPRSESRKKTARSGRLFGFRMSCHPAWGDASTHRIFFRKRNDSRERSLYNEPVMHDERTLLKLRVYTKSGTHLGRLTGFEYDNGSQMIMRYKVRPKGLTARILKTPLLISREQVIRVEDERMVVEDNVEREMEAETARIIGLVETEMS